eukprot:5715594-Pleurochrysis_carterae.AAC.1
MPDELRATQKGKSNDCDLGPGQATKGVDSNTESEGRVDGNGKFGGQSGVVESGVIDGEKRFAAENWGGLVGYAAQKQEVEEALLLPLLFPHAFDRVCEGTREDPASSRPKALLLHGPPGTGKTRHRRAATTRSARPPPNSPLP